MIDTMTGTKIVGGFGGALLVFLLVNWASEGLYHAGGEGEGYGEEVVQGYVIDTGAESAGDTVVAVEAPVFAEVYASASAGDGETLFRQCKACHKLEAGANGTGPSLYGVVGRAVDAVEGYSYSGALTKVAESWTPESLDGFLADPKGFAPGTKMSYKGMADIQDRANLIAYLATIGG